MTNKAFISAPMRWTPISGLEGCNGMTSGRSKRRVAVADDYGRHIEEAQDTHLL